MDLPPAFGDDGGAIDRPPIEAPLIRPCDDMDDILDMDVGVGSLRSHRVFMSSERYAMGLR